MADLTPYRSLHEKALIKAPRHINLDPGDILVAVLNHPEAELTSDFTWFKCRPKHNIRKVKNFYGQRVNCEVDLVFGCSTPADKTLVSALDYFDDGIVALQAVAKGGLQGRELLRAPLKTVITQVPSKSGDTIVAPCDATKSTTDLQAGIPSTNTPASAPNPIVEDAGLSLSRLPVSFFGSVATGASTSFQQPSLISSDEDWKTQSANKYMGGTDDHLKHRSTLGESESANFKRQLKVVNMGHEEYFSPDASIQVPKETTITAPASRPCTVTQTSGDPNDHFSRSRLYNSHSDNTGATILMLGKLPQVSEPHRGQPHSSTSVMELMDAHMMTRHDYMANVKSLLEQPPHESEAEYTKYVREMYQLSPQGPLRKQINFTFQARCFNNSDEAVTPGRKLPTFTPLCVSPATTLAKPSATYLRLEKMLAEGSPEELEAEVKRSLALLHELQTSISPQTDHCQEAQQWLQQIENLKKQNINEPTIIGVVGNTGAGKSSVINALLDEERLVPTNCMRACTAVVTEISWNASTDEDEKYRSEIEFIQAEDWARELRILFQDLLDGSGKISREAYEPESEAGVAYAKIRAVYPNLSKDEIATSSVDQLMRAPLVQRLLGTTRQIQEGRPKVFYRKLQHYVDSREKQSDEKKREMEFWPLIKVVKIFTRSNALSTGAVIVDLPGVMDSNAARGNVAKAYMKNCTGLWIVAPINRAVDDRAAHNLMGDAFKRQLKYDGTYSRITFICSKTDDISVTEAAESLGLDNQMSLKWAELDQIEFNQKRLERDLKELRESKEIFGEVLNDTDDKLEVWDKLMEEVEDGKVVFPPGEKCKKRKRRSREPKCRRRTPMSITSEDEDELMNDDSDVENTNSSEASPSTEPLSMEMIQAKISELKETKKDTRSRRRYLDAQIQLIDDELIALEASHREIDAEMNITCISGRNNYSKGAIQRDFAAGIKELDQEAAEEMDEANFNPDEDVRNYEEVARSLPVFCVSSRAYQKLSGRLRKDQAVSGFTAIEQTEIPQLQVHCKKLTEGVRISSCRRFLNSFSQLFSSMSLWSSTDGSGISLTRDEIASEGIFLQAKLKSLEDYLEKVVQECLLEIKESLAENIYDHFQEAIAAAVDEANDTAEKWGAPQNSKNRAAGGLHYGTYKAICRRDGVYTNSFGLHDFNNDLSSPMIKKLGSHWERAFARRLPNVLNSFTKSTKALLLSFHKAVEDRVIESGVGITGMTMLAQQLQNYERTFEDLTVQMMELINECQRDANRDFVPVVAQNLLSAYDHCAKETGSGSYMRMKAHMTGHIDTQRSTMFHDATLAVKGRLAQMCRSVQEQMSTKSDDVFVLMQRDYLQVITGSQPTDGQQLPKWEMAMKTEVANILNPPEKKHGDDNNATDETDIYDAQSPADRRPTTEDSCLQDHGRTGPLSPPFNADQSFLDEPYPAASPSSIFVDAEAQQ